MKVAFVASEAVPYAKTGGLADVAGTLPLYLKKLGIETKIFLPKYKGISGTTFVKDIEVDITKKYHVGIHKKDDFYFIDCPEFFLRDGIYGSEKGDYPDNCERFTLFCKAVSRYITEDESFDIVHCNDWQSALIPLYLKFEKISVKTVFTIHNLGYQGLFPAEKFPLLGLARDYFTPESLEFYGKINFLKAGVLYSDIVTTVSENYAKEIQTPELGFGLDGVLRKRKESLFGIINGIDYKTWNPETDPLIYHLYNDYDGKQKNRSALIKEHDLKNSAPLLGIISRIAEQKGFDIIIDAFDSILDMGFNLIILGSGEEKYQKSLSTLASRYAGRVSLNIRFDNRLAHRIYAGSDFFLMPSRYEPCGLGQLISLRYGTVPVVRKTGGLADTIEEFDRRNNSGNGFLFEGYSVEEMLQALSKAYTLYDKEPRLLKALSEKCMGYDFSWEKSAVKYKELYESQLRP